MELSDRFGRVHTDLRISVTDRCNFRCAYCMPEEGMQWLARSEVLTFEEIERIARVLVERAGLKSIRLTGGEPTVRARLPLLVQKLAALGVDLAMTTNGATLPLIAHDLRAAGLERINISLDTLDRDRFIELTRRDELTNVLQGIDAALTAQFAPVKVNAVLMRGINDDEIVDFLRLGREKGVTIRFIEFMPLDAQGEWSNDRVVPYREILERASEHFDFEPIARGSSPAERFRYADADRLPAGGGEFGVIASVTEPFCQSCDRMRLSADGQLRNCLFALRHVDLRTVLRNGGTDDDLLTAIAGEVAEKWAGHAINQVHFIKPSKGMSQLGG
ncbi:MAG: GTP 3',8-cyclase MoaA [Actinomycetota bacterium]|nr:GTP 3',8-cyclase MoaA [Actinomycetota bacterium]